MNCVICGLDFHTYLYAYRRRTYKFKMLIKKINKYKICQDCIYKYDINLLLNIVDTKQDIANVIKSIKCKFKYNIGDILINKSGGEPIFYRIIRETKMYYFCENLINVRGIPTTKKNYKIIKIKKEQKNPNIIWSDNIKMCKYCKTQLINKPKIPKDWVKSKKDFICDLCFIKWKK